MANPEHRRAPRVSRSFLVRYRCPVDGQAAWLTSPLRDFSAEGARFASEFAFFNVGDPIELQLLLPQAKQPVVVSATVVWTKPLQFRMMLEVGVTFAASDAATKEVITHAVAFFHNRSLR